MCLRPASCAPLVMLQMLAASLVPVANPVESGETSTAHTPLVDDFFMQLSIPHARPLLSPAHYPLSIPRHRNGEHLHSRLLSDLLTICKPPSSDPIPTPAQEMPSVGVESNLPYLTGATGVEYHHCLVLLNGQRCSITPRRRYAPVFVDIILTNSTQSCDWKSERTRDQVRFTRAVQRNTFPYSQYGLSASCPRRLVSLASQLR